MNEVPLWNLLQARAGAIPGATAYRFYSESGTQLQASYQQVHSAAARLSGLLSARGVSAGDRVAVMMTNRPEWIEMFWACQALGAAFMPLNTRWNAEMIAYALGRSRPRALVYERSMRALDIRRTVEAVIKRAEPGLGGNVQCIEIAPSRAVRSSLADEVELQWPVPSRSSATQRSDRRAIGLLKYTSGSSGRPKGALLSQAALLASAQSHVQRLELDESLVWFSARPFFHVSGSVWGLLTGAVTGGSLSYVQIFEPARDIRVMESDRVTVNFAGTTMLRDEMRVAREISWRGQIPVIEALETNDALISNAREVFRFDTLIRPYGLTESASALSVCGPHDSFEQQISTNGQPFPSVSVQIQPVPGIADTKLIGGHSCPVGEVVISGDQVMDGYESDTADLDYAPAPGAWFRTGDLACIDHDGYLRYQGRVKLMLKVGGENVSVEELEAYLAGLDFVGECAVSRMEHSRLVEAPRAYLRLSEGSAVSDVVEACERDLPRYMRPREFVIVAHELPRLPSGKLDRKALEEWSARPPAASLAY